MVGDMIDLDHLPGVAQVAIQGAKYAAKEIKARLSDGKPPQRPFKYFDKGSMATISRFRAVALVGKIRLTGFLAWLMWLAVHLVYLTGFKNRLERAACTGRSASWAAAARSAPRPSSRSSPAPPCSGSRAVPRTWSAVPGDYEATRNLLEAPPAGRARGAGRRGGPAHRHRGAWPPRGRARVLTAARRAEARPTGAAPSA